MNMTSVKTDGSTPPASTAATAAGNNSNAGIGGRTRHLPDVSNSGTSLACPAPPKRSRPNEPSSATASPVSGINNIPTSTSAGIAVAGNQTPQLNYPPASHASTPATVIVYAPECQPRICVADLDRRCTLLTAGRSCPDYHSVHGFPYQWQWTVDDPAAARAASVWRDFGRNVNGDIEHQFCDVATAACTIYPTGNDAEVRLDFDAMTMSCDCGGSCADTIIGRVRRLETERRGDHPYATVWQWYWWSNGDIWNPYESRAALIGELNDRGLLTTGFVFSKYIERSYLDDPFGTYVWCDVDGTPYVVDFAEMTQTNVDRRTVRKVRRRPAWLLPQSRECSKSDTIAIRYPDSWDLTGVETATFQLVAVKNAGATEDEFRTVSRLFLKSLPPIPVKSIQRIQNRYLWKKFFQFTSNADVGRERPIDVRQLFHGTKRQYIDAICSKGFDWRLSGTSSGTNYGKGSYFARDASYSVKFTDCRMMFVVRVAVGEFALGNQDVIQPPPKDASRPYGELYDSCVDHLKHPSIFVTFDRDQCYPEYLIEY